MIYTNIDIVTRYPQLHGLLSRQLHIIFHVTLPHSHSNDQMSASVSSQCSVLYSVLLCSKRRLSGAGIFSLTATMPATILHLQSACVSFFSSKPLPMVSDDFTWFTPVTPGLVAAVSPLTAHGRALLLVYWFHIPVFSSSFHWCHLTRQTALTRPPAFVNLNSCTMSGLRMVMLIAFLSLTPFVNQITDTCRYSLWCCCSCLLGTNGG